MTDPASPPDPEPAPDANQPPAEIPPAAELPPPASPTPAPRVTGMRDALPWLCGLGFLVLAGGIGFVAWRTYEQSPPSSKALQTLAARVAQLEQRPAERQARAHQLAAAPAGNEELAALAARVTALEQRTPQNLSPLEARITQLEQRSAPALAPLQAQTAALQKQVTALEQKVADDSALAARSDALSARMDAEASRNATADSNLAHRLDTDEARLATLEQTTSQITAIVNRAALLARIEAAEAALAAGQPLGDLPAAPLAVTRFATANPPTEAALRLAFPQAKQAALRASRADVADTPLLDRMMTRAEDLVTVRQGDHVLLGNPAAGVLADAQQALDAGDLGAAVAAVSSLAGPPATAMAAWLANAKALLAARAGLATMATHA